MLVKFYKVSNIIQGINQEDDSSLIPVSVVKELPTDHPLPRVGEFVEIKLYGTYPNTIQVVHVVHVLKDGEAPYIKIYFQYTT